MSAEHNQSISSEGVVLTAESIEQMAISKAKDPNRIVSLPEMRYFPPKDTDPRAEIETLQIQAFETSQNQGNYTLAGISSYAYIIAKRGEYKNTQDFASLYKRILKNMLYQVSLDNPQAKYMKYWADEYILDDNSNNTTLDIPKVFLPPDSEAEFIKFIPGTNPNKIEQKHIQLDDEKESLFVNYVDEKNDLLCGPLTTFLIIQEVNNEPRQIEIPFAMFMDDGAFYPRNNPLIKNPDHQLNEPSGRRRKLITALRLYTGIPIVTQTEIKRRNDIETILETYKKESIIHVKGYYARRTRKAITSMFDREFQEVLNFLDGFPNMEVGGAFEALSIGDHTDRVGTLFHLDSR